MPTTSLIKILKNPRKHFASLSNHDAAASFAALEAFSVAVYLCYNIMISYQTIGEQWNSNLTVANMTNATMANITQPYTQGEKTGFSWLTVLGSALFLAFVGAGLRYAFEKCRYKYRLNNLSKQLSTATPSTESYGAILSGIDDNLQDLFLADATSLSKAGERLVWLFFVGGALGTVALLSLPLLTGFDLSQAMIDSDVSLYGGLAAAELLAPAATFVVFYKIAQAIFKCFGRKSEHVVRMYQEVSSSSVEESSSSVSLAGRGASLFHHSEAINMEENSKEESSDDTTNTSSSVDYDV